MVKLISPHGVTSYVADDRVTEYIGLGYKKPGSIATEPKAAQPVKKPAAKRRK